MTDNGCIKSQVWSIYVNVCVASIVQKQFTPYPALISMRHHKEAPNSRFCFVLSAGLISDTVPLQWIWFIFWMQVSDI